VSLGADAVLLIVRALSPADLAALSRAARERGLATVVEAHGEEEIAAAAAVEPDVLGINSRNLSDFSTDLAAVEALAPRIPRGPVRLAESGIASAADVRRLQSAGYEAFLVGEALLRAENPEEALRDLQA
jgi:indole-3-glycerol phosphate synthase